MLPLGFASIAFTTSANSRLQLEVPDALRGRVMSLYTLLFAGTTPIGGLVTGFLAEHLGVQWALGIEAVICGAGVIAGLTYHLKVSPQSMPKLAEASMLGYVTGVIGTRQRASSDRRAGH
jgi:MFS family permease